MAFPVLKILCILIVFFCGLQVDCKVERYSFNIVENGTSFKEEVEVDEDEQTEVFRVPRHNQVNATEVMNDFNAALSVLRDPVRKACFVSKLDPSLPSPGKLKFDMDQASRQSSVPNDVTTNRAWLNVVGFADRSALPQKFLKFCDTFPIYETTIEEMPLDTLNTSLSQTTGPARFKRQYTRQKRSFTYNLCSDYDRYKLRYCLKKYGYYGYGFRERCRTGRIYCYYIVRCHRNGYRRYSCYKILHNTIYGRCCTPYC